jgi:Periplasmic binding protein
MRRLLATAVVALLAIVAAAVGSAGAATGPSTSPTSAAPATRGVTATSIKVAGLGTSLLYGDAQVGAKARFTRANAEGGVNGRTIDFTGFTDDGGDPAADAAAVAKLAAADGVFAVVPTVASTLGGVSDLVNDRLPYFGWALSSSFCRNGYGFGFTGCAAAGSTTSNAWGLAVRKSFGAQSAGATAAVLTENSSAGQYALKATEAGLAAAQVKVVYGKSVLPVPSTGDYGALLKDALTSSGGKPPRSVFVVGSYSSVAEVQAALRDAGYLGMFTNLLEYDPNLVAQASGASVFVQTAAVETSATNAAMKQLVDDVQKVAPDQAINQAVVAGYFSADMFLAAVKKAGRNLTVGSLITAANAHFAYRVADTVGPTTFPAAHFTPTPCGSLVQSDGTAFKVVSPYTCGKVVRVK